MISHPSSTSSIGAAELQKLLSDVEPAALLVRPRLLRRVIKDHCRLNGVGMKVPHRKTYTLHRDSLLAIADHADLGLAADRELPTHLLLLACPDTWLASRSRDHVLVRFWRLLFHARIDRRLDELLADGKLTDPGILDVLQRVGLTEAEEAFRVLRHENFLLPPDDLRVRFREFVALFLELRYFARPLAARYFPAIEDLGRVEAILGELVDAPELFRRSRLEGAPDPVMHAHDHEIEPSDDHREGLPPPRGLPSSAKCQKLLVSADRAGQRGNVVRSAILRLRAADIATPEQLDVARQGALNDLDRLVKRLQAALELHDREANEWLTALRALLGPASRGIWPPSARLLYDLQKVCVDHERDLYALDLVEWVVSLFRKPIKRAVPLQADVLLVKHLRSAASRLAMVRIGDEDRRRLAILLRSAIHHCEERLREKVRPLLTESLEEVGFRPESQPERLALRKIVEELLDRVAERGFLNMGDVRDAVSRNQLKLPDATPRDLLLGDRLLKANRKLAFTLDGVYRRGEVYLRGLQRLSSLMFGTLLGRWLTLYLLLPVGGAFALIVFWDEMVHLTHVSIAFATGDTSEKDRAAAAKANEAAALARFEKAAALAIEATNDARDAAARAEDDPANAELAAEAEVAASFAQNAVAEEREAELAALEAKYAPKKHLPPSLWTIGAWSIFLFLLMHAPPFRRAVWEAMKLVWKGFRAVLFDAPAAFFRLVVVQQFLESAPVQFLRRRLLLPLMLALLALVGWALLFPIDGVRDELAAFAITFLVAVVLLGSRIGRRMEEAATDWLAHNWYWLRVEAVGGLIGWIIWFFKELMDRIERVLYTVDEWLRFRPGDSALALVYKPLLGLFWFVLTYVIRIVINLMIEPTVNPVKHFPAVTVGAKLIIPMIPAWSVAMTHAMSPFMGVWLAGAMAGTLILLIPGVFGFAAWELKENWRLYRANRNKNLSPVMIGSHGETMVRFMKPGFHSGTLPKLYARYRQAERRGDGRKIHKQHEALHHVTESIKRFAERELLFLLEQARSWGGLRLLVGEVKAATNWVRIELRCPDLDETGLWLVFEERSGWLTAGVLKPGWLGKLSPAQTTAFRTALAGLYKMAGVHLVHEQIETTLSPGPFAVEDTSLILYPNGDLARPDRHLLYVVNGTTENGEAVARLNRLRYDRSPIAWDDWVRVWEDDRMGETPDLPLLHAVRLLPVMSSTGSSALVLPVA